MNTHAERTAVYQMEYVESRDADFLRNLVKNPECSVLEVPCGTGRLATQIADNSSSYTIADINGEMVQTAKFNLLKSGVKSEIFTHVGDMCSLSMDKKFDWIIVPREALQLLPPSKSGQAIASLCALLTRQTGRLIIDLASFRISGDPDYYYPQHAEGKWYKNWTRTNEKNLKLTRWSMQSESENKIEFSFYYEKETSNCVYRKFESEMTLYKYSHNFIDISVPGGFEICGAWGDYDYSPLSETSNRMICLIRGVK